MKRIQILLSALLFVGVHVSLWGQAPKEGEWITFDPPLGDFHEVEMGEFVEQEVRFQNASAQEIIVSHVKPGCGCTKVAFEADTLAPGEWGHFLLTFDTANRLGKENLSASLIANAGAKFYKWRMSGTVIAPSKPSEKAGQTHSPLEIR